MALRPPSGRKKGRGFDSFGIQGLKSLATIARPPGETTAAGAGMIHQLENADERPPCFRRHYQLGCHAHACVGML